MRDSPWYQRSQDTKVSVWNQALLCIVRQSKVMYLISLQCNAVRYSAKYCSIMYSPADCSTVQECRSVASSHHQLCAEWRGITMTYCPALPCTKLYCCALYCIISYCTVIYFTVVFCTLLYCTMLYVTLLYSNSLTYFTLLDFNELNGTVLYCNVPLFSVLY